MKKSPMVKWIKLNFFKSISIKWSQWELFVELVEIKMQLESTLGKEEVTRQISRQRSHFSESVSEGKGEPQSPNVNLSRYDHSFDY